jgi:hypothetical protein
MSNKSDKKKEEELRRENEGLRLESERDRAALREPSALDKEAESQSLGWFNFLKDPNRDFSKAPMPFSGLAEDGAAAAEEERTALGAMRFGAAAADPNLQAVLKENIQERRVQRRGQALEDAVARYDSLMRGMAGEVAARDQARRLGVAGMTTNAGANALNSWAAFTPRPHWGLSLAAAGIAGAGSVLSGGFGAGGAFNR